MDAPLEFDINASLKQYLSDPATITTPDADAVLQDVESDPSSLDAALVNRVLNPIVDAIAEAPDAILQSSHFDSIQFLLKCAPIRADGSPYIPLSPNASDRYAPHLPTTSLSKLFDTLISGLSAEADSINADLDTEHLETTQQHRQLLEAYAFLLQWTVAAVENKAAEKSSAGAASVARGRNGKVTKTKASGKDSWDSATQIQAALDVMGKVLRMKLSSFFVTTSDRDTFVGLFTRAVYLVQESETRMKSTTLRMHTYKVLCIAVKHHGHAYGAQTSIIQNLSYFEHLSEHMAEFLQILAEQYDFPQLAEDILRELSNKEFNNNDLKGPKSISTFVAKLSELAPRLVIKQMSSLAKFLDSESYTLRCAIIEVCGNLISMLSNTEASEQAENHKTQINAFFDVLEERFLDVNPYCRCRVLQTYVKLCDLETKFPKRRQAATQLAVRSLEDKSSNVRRYAIRLLGKLITTHPFSMLHGGQLTYKDWLERLEAVQAEMDALQPPQGTPGLAEKTTEQDDGLLDEATQIEDPDAKNDRGEADGPERAVEQAATAEAIGKLQLTRRYYSEAVKFVEQLHEASPIIAQLLLSKNKSEVIEAMDFFMVADAYKVETARVGIRKMMHLIWTKGNSDEGKGVQTHLIECYKRMFFDAPDSFSPNDAANYVARNMISLTFGSTMSELTSLEQLLSTMTKSGMITDIVIAKLWQIFGVQRKEISKKQRRGAITIISMLAAAKPEILINDVDTMLQVGLGRHGQDDLALARQTCIALARLNSQSTAGNAFSRLPDDHPVVAKLAEMSELTSDSKSWYGLAEQAISAIYALAKHPDNVCSVLLRKKTKQVFEHTSTQPIVDEDGDVSMNDDAQEVTPQKKSASSLSQLLFLVGHVAIKQIVHLELCELDFKRRKADREKTKQTASPTKKTKKAGEEAQAELDLIGGTTEDDFTEAIAHIRERELLYGQKSLLASYGPLVTEICSKSNVYNDSNLQAIACICMAKLMCVSSEFCEKNLPLLITILEKSEDPITRSNAVIALGDMAVCFNNLIDENTDFLYRRLNDNVTSVKRTCLMTLTFLILAGQVKVKGQLGEMAKCLEDPDRRIADLSRMFFTELATKDNAVYNQYVDMFSLLSTDAGLSEENFKKILKFLSAFIEKDKHAKQLAQKLAARLNRCDTERQWNDVAYALSLLQHKDEEIQKTISEGFKIVETAA